MGGLINRLAYVWLVTTEMVEELLCATIGDSFRYFIGSVELRTQAPRIRQGKFTYHKAADSI